MITMSTGFHRRIGENKVIIGKENRRKERNCSLSDLNKGAQKLHFVDFIFYFLDFIF